MMSNSSRNSPQRTSHGRRSGNGPSPSRYARRDADAVRGAARRSTPAPGRAWRGCPAWSRARRRRASRGPRTRAPGRRRARGTHSAIARRPLAVIEYTVRGRLPVVSFVALAIPVVDELLRFLVELALGPGPELPEGPAHLLGEFVGGPRLDREEAEDGVRRRRQTKASPASPLTSSLWGYTNSSLWEYTTWRQDRWTSRSSTPTRPRPGTGTRAMSGPKRPTGTTGRAVAILAALPRRGGSSARRIGCSTSGAGPGGRPARRLARSPRAARPPGIDLSTRMLELARAPERGRGPRQRAPSSAATRRSSRSTAGRVRRRHEQLRRHVLQRSRRRVHEHRRRIALRRIACAARRGGPFRRTTGSMSLRGALAVGRDLPMPPPDAPTPFSPRRPRPGPRHPRRGRLRRESSWQPIDELDRPRHRRRRRARLRQDDGHRRRTHRRPRRGGHGPRRCPTSRTSSPSTRRPKACCSAQRPG